MVGDLHLDSRFSAIGWKICKSCMPSPVRSLKQLDRCHLKQLDSVQWEWLWVSSCMVYD